MSMIFGSALDAQCYCQSKFYITAEKLFANVGIALVIGVKNNGTRGISAINKEGNNKTEKYKEGPMK